MRVIIRDAAYDDLESIFRWIERDRPQAAHSVIERILVSIERLG
jgi:plasmid stabilization system protein ParE